MEISAGTLGPGLMSAARVSRGGSDRRAWRCGRVRTWRHVRTGCPGRERPGQQLRPRWHPPFVVAQLAARGTARSTLRGAITLPGCPKAFSSG